MPTIMGILNVTPDSFSDGGAHNGYAAAIKHAMRMVEEGATIIDVGGESTRPGSCTVSIEEEIARTVEVVKTLAERSICVSIDTRHAEVARACVDAGASIINDISGFRDPSMVAVARECDAGVVVMHMKGEPATMQQDTHYVDVVGEVLRYVRTRAGELENEGIAPERICIDPGPGFGKTADQSWELMGNMHEFARLGYPVMAAVSRKAYIGKRYGIDDPLCRDEASAIESLKAVELGASVVRTHNVACTAHALKDLRPYCFLSLGSNVALVGNDGEERDAKIAVLNQAIASLVVLPDSQIIDISSFYESEPAYVEDQDSFVNAIVLMRTGVAPGELLDYIHTIEDSLGRVRTKRWGPRTCDIDIVDYQGYVYESERLTLPHLRATERGFVVAPLMELRPHHVLADGTPVIKDTVTVGHATKC